MDMKKKLQCSCGKIPENLQCTTMLMIILKILAAVLFF